LKRALALMLVAVGVAAASASAASESFNAARFATIFQGQDWSLVAWRNHGSVCLSYGAPGAAGNGCGIDRARTLGVLFANRGRTEQLILGTTRVDIVRVVLRLPNGKVFIARLRAAPAQLRIRVSFFEIHSKGNLRQAIVSRQPFGIVQAYDREGHLVSSVKV
jgi:hypothetical protein